MYHTRLSKLKLSEDLSSRGSSLKLGDPNSRAIKGALLSVELGVGRKIPNVEWEREVSIRPLTQGTAQSL